jgi:hypothetical protein
LKRLLLRAGWAPVGVVVLHEVASALHGHDTRLDPIFHLLGGAAMAFFFGQAVHIRQDWFGRSKPVAWALISFCMATTVAVFWEFIEFAGGGFGAYSQVTLGETMGDLVLGCTGAAMFVVIAGWRAARKGD